MNRGMSMPAEQREDLPEPAPKPRVLAVEVGGWPGLGGRVRLELGERRTVLVGKNGAGKSLLLEGIWEAATAATAVGLFPLFTDEPLPSQFLCEVETPELSPIAYEYTWETAATLRR